MKFDQLLIKTIENWHDAKWRYTPVPSREPIKLMSNQKSTNISLICLICSWRTKVRGFISIRQLSVYWCFINSCDFLCQPFYTHRHAFFTAHKLNSLCRRTHVDQNIINLDGFDQQALISVLFFIIDDYYRRPDFSVNCEGIVWLDLLMKLRNYLLLCFSGIWAISQSNLIMLVELSNLTQCWACLNPLILIEFKHV